MSMITQIVLMSEKGNEKIELRSKSWLIWRIFDDVSCWLAIDLDKFSIANFFSVNIYTSYRCCLSNYI